MNILLIEPDLRLSATYELALRGAGHVVSAAGTAQQAVHSADGLEPDLVILELQLAAHNGVEFIYEFRSYAEWIEVPIILLTMVAPRALQITDDMLKQLGIVDILYKPATTLRQLVRAVHEVA